MTTLITWLNNPYVIGTLLLVSATTDLILWGLACDLSKADWGTWVGSIGTVATLLGTIWLATATKREERKQANDRAVVAAAALGPKLEGITAKFQTAVEFFLDHSKAKKPAAYFAYANLLEDAATWTDDEILPLIVLPKHVCTRLAGTRSIVQNTIIDMRYLANNWQRLSADDDLASRQGTIAGNLVMCRDVMQFAIAECRTILQKAMLS